MSYMNGPTKVVLSDRGPLMTDIPEHVRSVLGSHWSLAKESQGQIRTFSVDMLPPSLNHQHERNRNGGLRLSNDARAFRELVWAKIPHSVRTWRPQGILSVVALLQSDRWVSKDSTVMRRDVDNMIKPVLDAIEGATGIEDHRFFTVTAMKIPSACERLTVYLFSLGENLGYHK